MTSNPTGVSVVIPAYNAAWCIKKAIDSVLAQTLHVSEILVVDDGSTDNTREVLQSYKNTIRVIHKPNGGLSSARNTGILAATCELVAFLDADDWWLPGKCEAQAKLLHQHPEIGFCSTAARVEDSEGQLLNIWSCPERQGNFLMTLFLHNAAVAGSGSAVMVQRELFDRTGLFDEQLRSLEDIDMWMRLSAISSYICLPEPLAVILKSQKSMSRNREVMRAAAIRVMRKNRPLLPSHLQGNFWRDGMAGVFADYAKWEYREGIYGAALLDTLRAFSLSPVKRGRLCLSLLRDLALGRSV